MEAPLQLTESSFFSDLSDSFSSDMKQRIDSFNEGYENGYTWPDIWESPEKPGGPWVSSYCNGWEHPYGRGKETCFRCMRAKLEADCNRLWRQGWVQGHTRKLAEGKSNPPRG